VFSEIGGGIERAAEALTRLGERESIVLVKVAAGSLGVLHDDRAGYVVVVRTSRSCSRSSRLNRVVTGEIQA
jgi:hypothetical protein